MAPGRPRRAGYLVLVFRSQVARGGPPEAEPHTAGSVTGLPLESLHAPELQTAGSVTGLPLASVHAAAAEELDAGPLARTGELLSSSAANAEPARTSVKAAASAGRRSGPCFMVCL